jgi:hypothetical protein
VSTLPSTVQPAKPAPVVLQRTLWRNAVRSFSRNRLAMAGLVVVLILILCAAVPFLLAPQPY